MYLAFEATKRMGATVSATIAATAPLFSAAGAMLALGEHLTLAILVGTLGTVVGIMVLSWKRQGPTNWALSALLFPIGAAAIRGTNHIVGKFGLEILPSPYFASLVSFTVSFAGAVLIYRYRVGRAIYYGELVGEDLLARCIRPSKSCYEIKRAGGEDALSEVEVLPPTLPTKIVCIGRNYREHAAEMGNVAPESAPLMFFKPPSCLIADGAPIVIPPGTERVDYEGEIALVISETCRKVDAAEAYKYLLGVTAFNDVTARDWQKADKLWTRAKGCDTFGPCGPYIDTSAAEALRLGGERKVPLTVTTRLNGEVVQQGGIDQLTFNFAALISYVSQYMTLEAGDLIATGTPAGVGPVQPGDAVTVELNCGPRLVNPVVAHDDPTLKLSGNGKK